MSGRDLRKLFGFLIAGGIGFCVDAGVLWLGMHRFGLGTLSARGFSFTSAMLVTWLFNRAVTFAAQRGRRTVEEVLMYLGATFFSGAVNVGVYAGAVKLAGGEGVRPFFALVLGVGAGMISNFLLYNRLVFRRASADTAGISA